ncbi:MAG: hypothetical protein ABSD68_02715 [Candidatus Micrarchaeales archaeon]
MKVSVDNDGTLRNDVQRAFRRLGLGNSRIAEPFRELIFLVSEVLPNKGLANNFLGQIKESFKEELDKELVKELVGLQRKHSDLEIVVRTSNPGVSKSDMDFMKGVLTSNGLRVSGVEFRPVREKGIGADAVLGDGTFTSVAASRHGAEIIMIKRGYNRLSGAVLSMVDRRAHYVKTSEVARVLERMM